MPETGTDPLFYGLVLMVVGMSVVFAFLVLMVVAISASAKVIARYFPPEVVQPAPAIPPVEHAHENDVHVAVMLAAVRHAQKGHA